MLAKVIHVISDRLAPVVIAKGAEVEWDTGDVSPEQWDMRGKELFADFEGRGIHRGPDVAG